MAFVTAGPDLPEMIRTGIEQARLIGTSLDIPTIRSECRTRPRLTPAKRGHRAGWMLYRHRNGGAQRDWCNPATLGNKIS
jgi:hypothetical protein